MGISLRSCQDGLVTGEKKEEYEEINFFKKRFISK